MQNINQLYHFHVVAQEGSFARAAEIANITQPALSNSIRALENKLGFQLFERSERPIQLTSLGKSLLPRVEALLFEARNLDQELANLSSGAGGQVRVAMTAVFSTSLGGPIIAEWHNAHPDVKLDLLVGETVDLLPQLLEGEIDLLVGDKRDLPAHSVDLDIIELPPQKGGAFCRAGHPILTIPRPVPADLVRYRFAGTHFPEEVLRAFARTLSLGYENTSRLISVDSHNIAALRDAVAESDLILLTTPATVRNVLSLGILRQIPVDLGVDGIWSITSLKGRVTHPAVPDMVHKIMEISKRDRDQRLVPYARPLSAT